MPYANAWEPRGVCTQFSGFVTAEEYVRSAEDICADPRFDGLRFVIKHLLAIDDHAIDPHALEPIAAIRYGALHQSEHLPDPADDRSAAAGAGPSGREVVPARAVRHPGLRRRGRRARVAGAPAGADPARRCAQVVS